MLTNTITCPQRLDVDTYGLRVGWVNLIGEDVLVGGLIDGLVETREELLQSLAATTNQHGQAAILVGSGGDTADGNEAH